MKKRLVTSQSELDSIIQKCKVCYVGMVDLNHQPYVLPFNFGYKDQTFYLHSALEGKKMEILKHNSKVCIAFSTDHQLSFQSEDVACSFGMKFRSVVAFGNVAFIDEDEKKIEAMNIIMQKYTGKIFSYATPAIRNVAVFKVLIDSISGKELGY
jgi:nitroimidazol reductase NimA-like FMN-containing flavoprotein (pyridoxamine 5'-phosphate oxidase superfamily)